MMMIYRPLYFILRNLALVLRPVLGTSAQKWIDLRQQSLSVEIKSPGALWFHASSGEIEYCKSVIRELKKRHPQKPITVTYSSASAEKLFSNISSEVSQFIPLGWDSPSDLQNFIQKLKPSALIFSRTDLWPELISQAEKAQIPMGLIAYNPQFSLFKNYFYRRFLKSFRFISCVQADGAEQLKKLLAPIPVQITADGDTRYDQVFFRLQQPSRLSIEKKSPILALGSTWPEDEKHWWPLLNGLKASGIQFIISPHDVSAENISRVSSELLSLGLKLIRLSSTRSVEATSQGLASIHDMPDVLLIDEIGFLADAYRFADVAFVGGSFKEKVHSVMEPLCCGLHVFVGPHYRNNPEAVRYIDGFVLELPVNQSPEQQIQLIKSKMTENKNLVLTEMQKNKNATQRVTETIEGKILKI